jgi:DnaD/phage-associated family protein
MINPQLYQSVIAVPTAIIDDYIKLANGYSIKVLLYILRHNEQKSAEEIGEYLSISTENVQEALSFWTELGVITNERQAIIHTFNAKETVTVGGEEDIIVESKSQKKPKLTPQEISEKINNSDGLKSVFEVAETYFQCKLNAMQCNSLIWLHEELNFSPESIMLLIDFCSERDKLKWQYIETVAYDWWKKGILTPDLVKLEIARLKDFYEFSSVIRRLFFLNAPLTKSQKDFAEKWQTFGFSEDVLKFAYEITVEKTGKCPFKYIDTILEKWHQNEVKTLEDVAAFTKNSNFDKVNNRQKQQALSKQCSYDLNDVLEKF